MADFHDSTWDGLAELLGSDEVDVAGLLAQADEHLPDLRWARSAPIVLAAAETLSAWLRDEVEPRIPASTAGVYLGLAEDQDDEGWMEWWAVHVAFCSQGVESPGWAYEQELTDGPVEPDVLRPLGAAWAGHGEAVSGARWLLPLLVCGLAARDWRRTKPEARPAPGALERLTIVAGHWSGDFITVPAVGARP